MKRSSKISAASIAALSLPLAGAGIAAAQDILADPVPVIAHDESATIGSSVRSTSASAPIVLAVTAQDETESTGIDPMRGWSEDNFDAYGAYWEAGYNYAQLLFLAEEWNMSEFEAKAQAGRAILAGDTSSFDALVEGIEPDPSELEGSTADYVAPSQSYFENSFDYDDAVVLAAAWNTSPAEAKVMAGELIDSGDLAEVQTVLDQA